VYQSTLNRDDQGAWATGWRYRGPWFESRNTTKRSLFWKVTRFENCLNFQNARAIIFQKRKKQDTKFCIFSCTATEFDRGTPGPHTSQTNHWTTDIVSNYCQQAKCFVLIPCFIGRFYNSGNECNWTNTEQLVFTKPCPQKGFMKTWKYVFQTFQFMLNLTGTKPQFAEIFRYYITKAEIIQIEGSGPPLNRSLENRLILRSDFLY